MAHAPNSILIAADVVARSFCSLLRLFKFKESILLGEGMFRRTIVAVTVVSVLMLGVLLFTTTPSDTGPLGILGFFVFMYLTALGVLTFLFRGLSILAIKLLPMKRNLSTTPALRTSYYYASVVALIPVMIIAIQSVGELSIYQILLIAFFVVVAWIYVTNRTS